MRNHIVWYQNICIGEYVLIKILAYNGELHDIIFKNFYYGQYRGKSISLRLDTRIWKLEFEVRR